MASLKKQMVIVLLSVAVVFASGCIEFGEEEEPEGRALVVEVFEAIPDEVFSGDDFELVMDVRNMGDVVAENINPTLYSHGGATPDGDFDEIAQLNPPTEEFEGEKATFQMSMRAPEIRVTDETVTTEVRVPYEYGTEARILIPALSKDEHRIRVETGETVPGIETARVTQGPFTVRIEGPAPALIEQGDEEFRFYVHGNNVGGGTPYLTQGHPDPSRDEINMVDVDLELHGASLVNDCDGEVQVRGGNSFQMVCRAEIDSVQDFQEIPIDISVDYGYRIRESTSLRVREDL